MEGGPGVVPWADGGAHRQLGRQRPGPREQGGGGQERVGDDPGEVVWALTCAGQPPMTKTDFAFGFDTVLAHPTVPPAPTHPPNFFISGQPLGNWVLLGQNQRKSSFLLRKQPRAAVTRLLEGRDRK